MKILITIPLLCLFLYACPQKRHESAFEPFEWSDETPDDCPFDRSEKFTGIEFLGFHSNYHVADTWYFTWASNDKLYSPYTDGCVPRLDGGKDCSASYAGNGAFAQTGQAIAEGNDPVNLKIYSLGTEVASAKPYRGRYPCGSLIKDGVWYYGTYCLDPAGRAQYGNLNYNWPWLGPFVGFRISEDYGRSWQNCPHTPEKPIFGETGINGYPVKIGSPHFVDFGKNMEHSPDGKAYLVAHGADPSDDQWQFYNASWITGDQIYLIRVTPQPENINDPDAYEFFAGYDDEGQARWTNDFEQIKPMLEWNNNMGCVTVTYNPVLRKYLMCVTDGENTCSYMHTYILEADNITGPWKIVTYMKRFGEQAYFVNIPSKFIESDGYSMWLCYSGNFWREWNGLRMEENPPGSHYGLVLQKIKLLEK
jgi:hypothetical protein